MRVTVVPRPTSPPPEGAGVKFQLLAAMVAHVPVALGTYDRQAADLGKLMDR